MKLRTFGLLTNENIHPDVIAFLRTRGFDVLTAGEAGLLGAKDGTVLRRAWSEHRFVLTHDADFARLAVVEGEPIAGIVYLRPGHIRPQFTIDALESLLRMDPEFEPPCVLVVHRRVDRVTIRIRAVPAR